MSLDEAKKVLDAEGSVTQTQVEERFQTLHKLNAPSEDLFCHVSQGLVFCAVCCEESPGSPYLQARISAAHKVLLEQLGSEPKSGAKPPEE
eukprot:symbB.v1.2.014305.t1/scaffold1034.1/size142864/18